jgi:hypothetical protein
MALRHPLVAISTLALLSLACALAGAPMVEAQTPITLKLATIVGVSTRSRHPP